MVEKQIPLVIVTESMDNELKAVLDKYSGALPASIIEAHLKSLMAEVAQQKIREISQAYAEMMNQKQEEDNAEQNDSDLH